MSSEHTIEHIDTIVIGAGQAGLSAGYHLAKRGLTFVILDADARIGDHWRQRWDSLKLYSPAKYDSLPGMRFPGPSAHWPTGREMADYLEAYARRFDLPVRSGVARRARRAGRWRLRRVDRPTAGASRLARSSSPPARSASRTSRRSPVDLDPSIRQLHSHEYRNPAQLSDGAVLVVGLSHSGADIAFEAADCRTPDDPVGPVPRPDADQGHRHETGHARLAGRRVRVRTRHDDPHAAGPEDAARSPQGRRSAPAHPPWRPGPGRRRASRRQDRRRAGRPADARRRLRPRRGQCHLGDRLPARLRVRRGADRRRGRLADRGPRGQSDGARPVLPRRPVPVRLHVDAGGGRRSRRGVRRRTGRRTRRGRVDAHRSSRRRPPEAGSQPGRSRSGSPT